MKLITTTLALSTAALLTACATPTTPGASPVSAAKADEHAAHQAGDASTAAPSAMHERMKGMQAMRDKMMNAKTPAERQALMDEHMKAMREGMAGMKNMPSDPAKHRQMMEMRMDMMQTMMEMMMQRMQGSASPPAGK